MASRIGLLVAALVAPVVVVVLVAVLATVSAVAGPIFTAVSPGVSGPGGVTPDSIQFGVAHLVFATAGILSVPASVVLAYFFGGSSQRETRPPRSGGGPF